MTVSRSPRVPGALSQPVGAPHSAGDPPGRPLTQAERAMRALGEAEQARKDANNSIALALLESSLDLGRCLRTVVAAVVPGFADWCFVDLRDESGVPRRVEVAYADPERARLAQEIRTVLPGPGWATPAAQAIRDGAPRLLREMPESVLQWATHDPAHLSVLRAVAPNSLIAVPLIARDRVIGAVTLIRSTHVPGFDERDLVVAEELAARAALALDNASAFAAERGARQAAERDADVERCARIEAQQSVARLKRLESVGASLAEPLAPDAMAGVAHEHGLSLLGCSSVTVVREADGKLELLLAHGWPEAMAAAWRTFAVDAPALVAEAFRIQTAIWIESPDALAARYPSASELARRLGDQAWAAAPLRVDGRTTGALGIGFIHPRKLDAGERAFVLAIAQQLAQALERARLGDLLRQG